MKQRILTPSVTHILDTLHELVRNDITIVSVTPLYREGMFSTDSYIVVVSEEE